MKKIVLVASIALAASVSSMVMAADGKDVYTQSCFACHGTGAAGAPKLGDKAAWAPRIAQGMDTLVKHAISGFSSKPGSMMPPKGGAMNRSDDEIKAAIDYIVEQSK